MNITRLNKLADYLDTLNIEQFNFDFVAKKVDKTDTITCGTVGCAIGFTPVVFPDLVEWKKRDYHEIDEKVQAVTVVFIGDANDYDYKEIGVKLFDISGDESERLFTPNQHCSWNKRILGTNVEPQEVAQSIRNFIKYHG